LNSLGSCGNANDRSKERTRNFLLGVTYKLRPIDEKWFTVSMRDRTDDAPAPAVLHGLEENRVNAKLSFLKF
jgi:hypothetical protein